MRNSKVVTLEEAIRRSGLKDGMTISFHTISVAVTR